MIDVAQIIHYIISAITAVTVAYIQYRAVKNENEKEEQIAQMRISIAVLSTRVDNEVHLLERMDNKMNRILDE